MKKSDVLKQKRAALIRKWDAIVKLAEKENRALTEAENTEIGQCRSECDALDTDIDAQEALEVRMAQAAGVSGTELGDGQQREQKKVVKRYSLHRAIRSQMPNGVLDGVELEVHQETVRLARESGIAITGIAIPAPSSQTRADGQTVTQDTGNFGGNLVDTTLGGVIELLRPNPILRQMGARFVTGLTGNVAFPTNLGGISASWEGEIATVPPTKNQYGKKEMTPKRLAVSTLISLQNLMQSNPDLEALTIQDMRAAVEEKIDLAGLNGSGTGNVPLGILNAVGTGSVAVGTNGGAPTWDHIVDLETAIYLANANAAQMGYIINTGTKGKLKKTKHSAGDLNYLMAMDNTINGYNVGITNLMPNNLTKGSGVALNAAIFGDFSQLMIGQWAIYDLSVDDKSQKKDGNIEITLNTFLDVMLRHVQAFSVVKDWNIT